jgi:hypothetical protein
MHGGVLPFAPAALAHRMWQVAATMQRVADTMQRSARVIDRAQILTARSRRLQRAGVVVGLRADTASRHPQR